MNAITAPGAAARKRNRLLISFSGGETSGFLAQWLLRNWSDRYDEIIVAFANTGQENSGPGETLDFVELCDLYFGLSVVWAEAEIDPVLGHGPRARVVTHATASRDGRPFEDMIKKYGIPNKAYPHCTRVLKKQTLEAYVRSRGWQAGSYDTAIGIRADEIDRMSSRARKFHLVYPLIRDMPMTKPQVNEFWQAQPFRLKLKGYQGNCKWCWKKSLRKHYTLLRENPEHFDFPERMEAAYGRIGPEFDPARRKDPEPLDPDYKRTFFRGSVSTVELRAQAAALPDSFVPAADDAAIYPDPNLDMAAGCVDSCEVYADEDEAADPDERHELSQHRSAR